jgi:hypothetical protein
MSRSSLAIVLVASLTATLAPALASAQIAPPPPVYAPPPPTGYAPTPTPAYGKYEYPAKLEWDEGGPIPQGYHPVTHVRRGLIIAGSITFGVLYAFSVLGADASRDDHTTKYDGLYIPGIGPFLAASHANQDNSSLLLIDGFGQCAGIIMFVSGFAFPKTELLRNDLGVELHVLPRMSKESTGLSLLGTF